MVRRNLPPNQHDDSIVLFEVTAHDTTGKMASTAFLENTQYLLVQLYSLSSTFSLWGRILRRALLVNTEYLPYEYQ